MTSMEPGIITRLDETVVNKIAAGEIIVRPSNALKELIENCIDAKSSNIQITVRGGGIQLLQIQDNGTGIRKDDLPILCERFTTSKLKTFEDLSKIKTYGFRGEALSSISQVSLLSVTTKTRNDKCAYKAVYEMGRLKSPPKPCAGNQGTCITIENLFYNLPSRLKSIQKDKSSEDKLLSDVVSKYAIHNSHVGFSLKINDAKNSLKTHPLSTQKDAIRVLYGVEIARNLLELSMDDANLKFKCSGLVTKPNFSIKKMTMMLFINHRLVKSAAMKKMIDDLYNMYIERGGKPFVYLSLEIDPENVDVNIHPTKNEVCFLHEETIIMRIRSQLDLLLKGKSESKTFLTQSLLPGASQPIQKTSRNRNDDSIDDLSNSNLVSESISYPKEVVRTDTNLQKLEKFFTLTPESQDKNKGLNESHNGTTMVIEAKARKAVDLHSIKILTKQIIDDCLINWRKVFEEMVFVGHVDRGKVLIQHHTELYLCDTELLCEELFSQQVINNIENCGMIDLEPGLDLKELALIALNELNVCETQPSSQGGLSCQAELVQKTLCAKSEILRKFFNINITESGEILSIPMIIENHTPNIAFLPNFILNLTLCVNYDNEKECFDTFSKVTGKFYSKISHEMDLKEWNWQVEHVLYKNLKQFLMPNKTLVDSGAILKVTSTQELYKVFERC